MSEHAYERTPLTLATGAAHTVKLPPRVMRGRLTGFLFDTNKTFILPAALTQETGELTPTLKLKRRIIAEKYGAVIESLYAGADRAGI